MKKPSPIRVRNPSENHLVPLVPNQSFTLVVPDNKTEIDFDEHYFNISTITKSNGNVIYDFQQKYDLTMWGRISRVFLGEVRVFSEKFVGSLCVILTPKNTSRPHVISLVNPYRSVIKATANDILEIVIYDKAKSNKKWTATIFSGPKGLRYELIGYRPVDTIEALKIPIVDDKELLAYPRSPLFEECLETLPTREHHYWFRCDSYTKYELTNPRKTDDAVPRSLGKIIFDLDGEDYKMLNITLKNTKIKYIDCTQYHNYDPDCDYGYDYGKNVSKKQLKLFTGKKEAKYYLPYYSSNYNPGNNFKNNIDIEYKEEDNDLHSSNVMYVC